MAIICWGNLAKSAESTQRIEQSIEDYIESHDENPNAHMGPDYALGAHRLMVELDHLPYSIFNKYLYPQSRNYKAIVDPVGNGDVTTIQAGIDYVNGLGGGTVYIKAGTYVLNSDITLYSNITLEGEDDDLTIIDFNNTTKIITAVGTFANRLTNIKLNNIQVKNSLNIKYGAIRFTYVNDSTIEECYFTGNWDSGNSDGRDIFVESCKRLNIIRCRSVLSGWLVYGSGFYNVIEKCFSDSSYAGLCYGIGYYGFIRDNIILDSTNIAIFIDINNTGTQVINNYIWRQDNYGISIGSPECLIDGNEIDGVNAGNNGIVLTSSIIDIRIVNNFLYRINGDCVYLNTCCDVTQIIGNQFYVCSGYGVVISNVSCDKNILLGNVFRGCSSGAYQDSGTSTVIEHNVTL